MRDVPLAFFPQFAAKESEKIKSTVDPKISSHCTINTSFKSVMILDAIPEKCQGTSDRKNDANMIE